MKRPTRLEYVEPAPALEAAASDFKLSFFAAGENFIHGSCRWDSFASYDKWLSFYRKVKKGAGSGRPQSCTYFARRRGEEKLVGVMEIRYGFDEREYRFGHIGYSVVPQERGKGYGTEMLCWGFTRAAVLGVEDVIVCCYEDNLSSRKAIEASGLRIFRSYAEPQGSRMVLEYRK